MAGRTPLSGSAFAARQGIAIFCFMLALVVSASQDARLPLQVSISRDTLITCSDASLKLVGSRTVRTPQLISPDGRRRAYAEVEADAFQMALGRRQECSHTSKLFVAGPNDQTFKLVFLQAPEPDFIYNWIKLVDWSPYSRYLLVELGFAQYGSDFFPHIVRIYDAQLGVLTSEGLEREALTKHFGKDCDALIQPLGFSQEGKVVLKIGPDFDEEQSPTVDSCLKQDSLWLLDPDKLTISTLPDDYKVRSYGSFKEAH